MQKHTLADMFYIRLSPQTNNALFAFARRKGIKRADLIREVLDHFEVAYVLLKQYEQQEQAKLNGDLTKLILDRFPELPPQVYTQLSEVLALAAERRREELGVKR